MIPHGEYPSAFPTAKILKINESTSPLFIPFWLMSFDELAYFLVGAKPTDDQKPDYRLLRELVTDLKKENCILKAGNINPDFITADSPIPFSARQLWYRMNWLLNASFTTTKKDEQTKDTAIKEDDGDAENLVGARFTSHLSTPTISSPFKSQHTEFYSYERKNTFKIKRFKI